MKVKLDLLKNETIFSYNGKQYQKGFKIWNSTVCENFGYKVLGEQIPNSGIRSVHPYLGEQLQENIELWFNSETMVEVE